MTSAETLEYVRLRCHCDEDSGCWTWKMYAVQGRFPQAHLGGRSKTASPVRRAVWGAARGPIKSTDWITSKCDNPLCVSPDHLGKSSRVKALKGKKIPAHIVAKIVSTCRVKSGLTAQDVIEIRASSESQTALAERYGVSHDNIHRIVNHQTWKGVGNPFTGLMR